MTSTKSLESALRFRRLLLAGVLVGLALIMLGWALAPAVSLFSVLAASLILIVYGLAFYFIVPGTDPQILKWAGRFGLLAGAVFAAEIVLEYIFLPKDNTAWGYIEFGAVFLILLISGFWTAYRARRFRSGVLSAVLAAMIGSLIWVIFVLAVFYIFRGTAQQAQVLQAEGDYVDFMQSGAYYLNVWLMEDFFGAVLFHSLLMPLVAAILGVIGAAVASLRLNPIVKSKAGI